MVVIGGRNTEVSKILPTALYDTEACEWRVLPPIARVRHASFEALSRTALYQFRHASWALGSSVYTFGGFDHRSQSHPTADLQVLNISRKSL